MNRAFRDRTTALGLSAADFGFGDIGGASDINTRAAHYAPGFNGSVAYTNSNYMLRAMAQYSTGLNKNGWAFSVSGIARYANEGVIEGTFYNSYGLFASLEKVFNDKHSLNLTVWGAPTQRASNSATYLEAYELADKQPLQPQLGLAGRQEALVAHRRDLRPLGRAQLDMETLGQHHRQHRLRVPLDPLLDIVADMV